MRLRATIVVSGAYRRWVLVKDPRDHDLWRSRESRIPSEAPIAGKRKAPEQAATRAHGESSVFNRLEPKKRVVTSSVLSQLGDRSTSTVFDRLGPI